MLFKKEGREMDRKKRVAQIMEQGSAPAHLNKFKMGSFGHGNLGKRYGIATRGSRPWGVSPNPFQKRGPFTR